MKFLVDNQLPITLSRYLNSKDNLFSVHVMDVGLDTSNDREIWTYAKKESYIEISKDEDFFQLASYDVEGPSVIWVRLGNCRKDYLLERFEQLLPELITNLKKGSRIIEIQ